MKLKPCPGCNGTNLESHEDGDYDGFVCCMDCGWNLRQKSKDEAEYLWNQRVELPVQPDEYTWRFKDDEELLAHFSMLMTQYAFADDSGLSPCAIELKKRLLNIIRPKREVGNHD